MKLHRIPIQHVFIYLAIVSSTLSHNLHSEEEITLASLDYKNPALKELREDVKHNLRVSRSNLTRIGLRPLVFYKYTVQDKDNFFKIMARTGMDIDTISSVNKLSSPYDLQKGMTLLIPNMRGIFDPEERPEHKKAQMEIAREYSIDPRLLVFDPGRKEWFIPGRGLGREEREFFYGMAFLRPLEEAVVSSRFGNRLDPFTKERTFHGGVDLAAPQGTQIHASADGVVVFAGQKGGYGNLIILRHRLGYETRYGHLSEIMVKKGQKLEKGAILGRVGMTGRATGPHLHFEVRRFSKRQRPSFLTPSAHH